MVHCSVDFVPLKECDSGTRYSHITWLMTLHHLCPLEAATFLPEALQEQWRRQGDDPAKFCMSVKTSPGVQSDCQSPVWPWMSEAFEGRETIGDLGDCKAKK